MRMFRKINLLVISMFVLACLAIQAQSPTSNVRHNQQTEFHPQFASPIGCSSNCLWYSGDIDFGAPNWDGLWNSNVPNLGEELQVWVPFVPGYGPWLTSAVQIKTVTFNEHSTGIPAVTNMTFDFRTGMSAGNAGTVIYSGNCNYSAPVATGRTGYGYTEYAYTCVLPKTITLKSGSIYWINLTPTLSNDYAAYLSNAIQSPELSHFGWGDVMDDSFAYGPYFDVNYANTDTLNTAFSEFSVGMTGQYVNAIR